MKEYRKNWEHKMKQLANQHHNPKGFWANVKRLKGKEVKTSPYIIHNNNKIYKEEEKVEIFKEMWEKSV